jgi:hypothetical protein
MHVTVQLIPAVAKELGRARIAVDSSVLAPETRQLLDAVAALGITLRPMHPGQDHPLLASYFVAEVADRPAAERVISRLQGMSVVEAAFLGPESQLP